MFNSNITGRGGEELNWPVMTFFYEMYLNNIHLLYK